MNNVIKLNISVLIMIGTVIVFAAGSASAANSAGVPSIYVFDNNNSIAATFGYSGTLGQVCKSDLEEVPDIINGSAVTVQYASSNPLQDALDKAADLASQYGYGANGSNGQVKVCFDAAEYTFSTGVPGLPHEVVAGQNIWYGISIPSSVNLKGVWNSGAPQTIISPSDSTASNKQIRIDIIIQISGSKTDHDIPFKNVTLESIKIDAKSRLDPNRGTGYRRLVYALRAYAGSNLLLNQVYTYDSGSSSVIFGYRDFNQSASSTDSLGCKVYYVTNFEIKNCNVTQCAGDGICVMGNNGTIHDNTLLNGSGGDDNGITPYTGSYNLEIYNNNITNFTCGIGADGSYLLKNKPDGTQLTTSEILSAYKSVTGYNYGLTIRNNTISSCAGGITGYRLRQSNIYSNNIDGMLNATEPQVKTSGITLHDSDSNYVYNNIAKNCSYAAMYIRSDGSSRVSPALGNARVGSSYNQIGVGPAPACSPEPNDFSSSNAYGVLLVTYTDSNRPLSEVHIRSNTISNNFYGSLDKNHKTWIVYLLKPTDKNLWATYDLLTIELRAQAGSDWVANANSQTTDLSVGDTLFTNGESVVYANVPGSGYIQANATIVNATSTSKPATIIIAWYNKDNMLKQIEFSGTTNISSFTSQVLKTGFNIISKKDGDYVKLFVWNNLNSIKSISQQVYRIN